jgi:hypothetical protein
MEFKYSEVVDPSTYHTEGLCDGIDVRRNKYTFLEDRGAIRAHEDWHKHIAPCRKYRGTLGPRFSFISVAVPECIPERLEVISYANEFAFLHDGTWGENLEFPFLLIYDFSFNLARLLVSDVRGLTQYVISQMSPTMLAMTR